jgi:hypothetical protein
LEEAVKSAKEDDGWNLRDGGEMMEEYEDGGMGAVARPKALTARDVYAVSMCVVFIYLNNSHASMRSNELWYFWIVGTTTV